MALGAWGVRWIGELGEQELDPKLLLWDMHRNIDHAVVPQGRTVVRFSFQDVVPQLRGWWSPRRTRTSATSTRGTR
jgi:hypothetical protein